MRSFWLKLGVFGLAALPLSAQSSNPFANHPPDTAAPPPVKQSAATPVSATPAPSMSRPPEAAIKKPQLVQPQAQQSVTGKGAAVPPSRSVRGKKKAIKEEPKQVEVPAPPPVPLTPEQLPAAAPQVSYLNGQLTIQSTNSTLSSILNAVRQQTGAQFEVPANAANQRVATRVGPGPVRDVLTTLLNGSAFDYIILGNPSVPGGVQRVILTAKGGGGAAYAPVNKTAAAPVPQPMAQPDENAEEEPDTAEAPEQPEQPEPPPPSPQPGPQPVPDQAQVQGGNPPAATPGQNPVVPPNTAPAAQPEQQGGANQVKTPEEMLKELQRLQQQQQARPQQ